MCFSLMTDGPKVTVSVRVNDVATTDWSAVEGSRVSLDCSTAVANPPVIPEATWWLREGTPVQDGRQPLVMQQLDRSHAGRYTCSATNTLSPSGELPRNVTATATVQLQVMCKLNHSFIRVITDCHTEQRLLLTAESSDVSSRPKS